MKKFLKFSALALLLCSAAAFVSCSNDDDDHDDGSSPTSGSQASGGSTSTSSNANDGTVTWAMSDSKDDVTEYELYDENSSSSSAGSTSGGSITSISQVENIRFGTGVSGKGIFKYYTVLPNNKVRYEQTKFGNYTSDVTSDYTEVKNADGTITLKLSNGVQKIEGAAFGDEDITFDFSTGADTPTLTSTYYERGEPVESTGQFTRVYSGIEKVIGNIFVHAVSGKSITSSYNFKADGTAEYKLLKYSKLNDYGHYKYQITAWNVLTADEVVSTADSETKILAFDRASLAHDLNTYAVHFVYAATETYTLNPTIYSGGSYGTGEKTVSVTEGEEPDSPYIFIKLVGDGVAKINVVKAIATTATE